MVLLNGLRKKLAAFFLIIFYASASLAAVNGMSLPSDTIARTMHPTNESPVKTSMEINSELFTGYFTNMRSAFAVQERKDIPVGSINECFEETASFSLHKDGDKIIWSIAPSLSKFSLNPIDDSKKIQVLLEYSLWF